MSRYEPVWNLSWVRPTGVMDVADAGATATSAVPATNPSRATTETGLRNHPRNRWHASSTVPLHGQSAYASDDLSDVTEIPAHRAR